MTGMELQKIEGQVIPALEQAKQMVVRTTEDIGVARGYIVSLRELRKQIEDTFNPIIQRAHQAHKEAVEQKKKYMAPLEKAESIIKDKISDALREIERRNAEERERAQAAAMRKQEEESRRVLNEIENLSREAEKIEKSIDRIDEMLSSEKVSGAQAQKLCAEKDTLLVRLDTTKASIQEKLGTINVTVQVPLEEGKVEGVVSSTQKDVEVINPLALVKAVAEGKVPISVIEFNMSAIRKLATAGVMLPGVVVTTKKSIKIRS